MVTQSVHRVEMPKMLDCEANKEKNKNKKAKNKN